MRGIRSGLIVLCLATTGCEGPTPANEVQAKYDSLKDTTGVYAALTKSQSIRLEPGIPRLSLILDGKGLHPKVWKAAFCVKFRNPEGEPDFWGDKGTLVFNPSVAGGHEFIEPHIVVDERPSIGEEIMFSMGIDDLNFLMDYGGKYTLNGKPFKLSTDEESAIKQAITEARRDSNSGK